MGHRKGCSANKPNILVARDRFEEIITPYSSGELRSKVIYDLPHKNDVSAMRRKRIITSEPWVICLGKVCVFLTKLIPVSAIPEVQQEFQPRHLYAIFQRGDPVRINS